MCETNDPIHFKEKIDQKFLNLSSIEEMIKSKKDIIGRNDSYELTSLDSNFPEYLTKNINKYKDWIA